MPCILKQRTKTSPGIITFTHNEVLSGFINKDPRMEDFLLNETQKGKWIFGVHIQGNCEYLGKWPYKDWQSFIMWPDKNSPFLQNIGPKKIINLNCVNFMSSELNKKKNRYFDICIVSRPSEIKRIKESIGIIRELMNLKSDLKAVFIVPDPRKIGEGAKTYKINDIDKNFFELPLKIFSSKELKNISFISSSTQAFGTFPIPGEFVSQIISNSRFLLLTSHFEGTPRVIGEALLNNTPIIVSKNLISGVNFILNERNCLKIEDNVKKAAKQIFLALNNYKKFVINRKAIEKMFSSKKNDTVLKVKLEEILNSLKFKVSGEWYLDDLQLRLAGHGLKYSFQFMDRSKVFIEWLKRIERVDPYDEDMMMGLSINKEIKINKLKGDLKLFKHAAAKKLRLFK